MLLLNFVSDPCLPGYFISAVIRSGQFLQYGQVMQSFWCVTYTVTMQRTFITLSPLCVCMCSIMCTCVHVCVAVHETALPFAQPFKDNEYCYEVHVWWNMADSKPRGIRAIFLGPPGAGKGTQVAPLRLAGYYHKHCTRHLW